MGLFSKFFKKARAPGELWVDTVTINLAEALGRIGDEKGMDAITWFTENAFVLKGYPTYWLERLENAKKWIKAINSGNFELIPEFLEQLLSDESFIKEKSLIKHHHKYAEWRWCAYILERRGISERVVSLLKSLYDLIDFYEKPRVMRLIRAGANHK